MVQLNIFQFDETKKIEGKYGWKNLSRWIYRF